MSGGGGKIFLFTQKYFGRLLQKHQIYFVGYAVIRRKFSGATQNFLLVFSFPTFNLINPNFSGTTYWCRLQIAFSYTATLLDLNNT